MYYTKSVTDIDSEIRIMRPIGGSPKLKSRETYLLLYPFFGIYVAELKGCRSYSDHEIVVLERP